MNSLSYRDLILDERLSDLVEEVKEIARQQLGPYLDFLALVPQIYLDIDPFYNSDIDSTYLVLVPKDRIPVKYLRELNLLLSQNSSPQEIEPCLVCGNIAVSLQPKNWYQCIKSPGQCPLFFSLLSIPSLHLSAGPNEISDKHVNAALPPKIEERTRIRIEAINDAMSEKNIYKLKTLDFLRFFWGAARAKLLAHFLKSGQVHIPLTSKQILEMLSQFSSRDSNWLRALHSEYTKELRGQESEAARYYSRSIEYLKRL